VIGRCEAGGRRRGLRAHVSCRMWSPAAMEFGHDPVQLERLHRAVPGGDEEAAVGQAVAQRPHRPRSATGRAPPVAPPAAPMR